MENQLKKHQNNMMISSIAFLILGLWFAMKSFMYIYVSPSLDEQLKEIVLLESVERIQVYIFFYVILILYWSIGLSIRFYIFLCARAEGKGKDPGKPYLILTAALFIIYVGSLGYNISVFSTSTESLIDTIFSLIIEISSIYNIGDLLYSGIKIKKLKKMQLV